MQLPPQDLSCPEPANCPVAVSLPRLRTATLRAGTPMFRVYDGTWGYDEHNPGFGDARFSPFDATGPTHPHVARRPTVPVNPGAAVLDAPARSRF